MYFWGASLIRCASCVLSHCWSTDIHAEENPWITQSEENSDFPSVHMQLNCVHCFYFWRLKLIKKKIIYIYIFSTITRLGAPSLYRNMTYSVVYWTYSHPQLLCILCICTPERQTETKLSSENVFPPILKIGTWVYNVWPMQLVYFRIHQCIDQTSARCYLGDRCDDIATGSCSDVALKDS